MCLFKSNCALYSCLFTVQCHLSPHVQGLEELQNNTDVACAEQAVGLVQLHVAEKLAIYFHFVQCALPSLSFSICTQILAQAAAQLYGRG